MIVAMWAVHDYKGQVIELHPYTRREKADRGLKKHNKTCDPGWGGFVAMVKVERSEVGRPRRKAVMA